MEEFFASILMLLVLAYGLRKEMERRERIRTRVRMAEEERVRWEREHPGERYSDPSRRGSWLDRIRV